ncbi:MAG: hypothetical protein ACOYMZ_01630 [Minisyncoccia bacterium]
MSDRIHFGGFSKSINDFAFTVASTDLDLFMEENPSLTSVGYDFSFAMRLQLSSFTEQKYGSDATKDIVAMGQEFKIVSLKAIERSWNNILSFIAVSSATGGFMAPSEAELDEIKNQVKDLYEATKDAKKKWGDKACFLIW